MSLTFFVRISLPELFSWSFWLTISSHFAAGTVPVILEWLISSLVETLVFLHSLQVLLAEHFKIVADFESWQSSQVDENPEFL